MIRSFEERFLLSNILEVGNIIVLGAGYFENYYMASKGFKTVCLNIPKALNHFLVAKMMKREASIDLYSIDLGGFNFPFEFFDYATFLNNSFELIPYRSNRIDMLKFVNRFIRNDSFLSISLYNPNSEENIKEFAENEFITETVYPEENRRQGNTQPLLERGDYFYRGSSKTSEMMFRHIYNEEELFEDFEEGGFEVVECTDDDHVLNGKFVVNDKSIKKLKGKYLIVSAKKVKTVKITKNLQ